ncbi:MAG: 4Fe-4S binding protein [Treponemataceae bacterium]|nr:4Fe-4S binding protein [Treponemataceae bacterium]
MQLFLKILFASLFFIFSTGATYVLIRFFNKIVSADPDSDVIQADIEDIPHFDKKTTTGMKAVVLCSPEKEFDFKKFNYIGQKDCNIFKNFYDSAVLCPTVCFGFGSCIQSCPENAIYIKNHTATISPFCTGCGNCVESCPNKIIKLFPINQNDIVLCTNENPLYNNCSKCKNKCAENLNPEANE